MVNVDTVWSSLLADPISSKTGRRRFSPHTRFLFCFPAMSFFKSRCWRCSGSFWILRGGRGWRLAPLRGERTIFTTAWW